MLNVAIGLGAWLSFLIVQQRADTRQQSNSHEKISPPSMQACDLHSNTRVPLPDHWGAITGSIILGLVGIYFGLIFLIFTFPALAGFITEIADVAHRMTFSDVAEILTNPLGMITLLFFLFTAVLLLLVPVSMIYLYISQFIQRLPTLFTPARLSLLAALVVINVTVLTLGAQQPQQAVFEQLEAEEIQYSQISEATMRALSNQHAEIRAGLLNAYLAQYRYLSTTGSSGSISHIYQEAFGISKELAALPQQLFNYLLTPFLYDGKNWESAKAAQYYAAFFDQPIQKAETAAILKAVRHNWNAVQGNEAGLLVYWAR